MSGLWTNVILGFLVALTAFGLTVALVFWLYRLAFGRALRLPMAGFSTTENTLTTAFFGIALAAAAVYFYTFFSKDYYYWNTYTLPKYQWIDYVVWSLLAMPSLFWFAGSLVASRAVPPDAAPAGSAPPETEPAEPPAPAAASDSEGADASS